MKRCIVHRRIEAILLIKAFDKSPTIGYINYYDENDIIRFIQFPNFLHHFNVMLFV